MQRQKFPAMKNLDNRRSIRKYSKREVSDALLNSLLTASMRTQTMGNLQLYSVVVTRDEKQKEKLAPAHFNQPMVTSAPVVLTICADFRRTSRWAECRQAQPGYNNFLSFINAATDALLFTQTFCCLAEEEGLGCCFLGTTVYQPLQIIKALRLPTLVMPVATITLGWPDEKPPLSHRLPLQAILHNESYKDYTPRRIDKFYNAIEQLPENQHFVKINQKQTLAQVFTDIRYTRSDNEAMSKGLLEALHHQGFL